MSGDFYLSANSLHNNSRAVCLNRQAITTFHQEALSDALAGFKVPF
jgi:hypothetical protein